MKKQNFELIKFSQIYFKRLTDKGFIASLNIVNNKRLEIFLPLYSAINNNYGLITDGDLLKNVGYYLKIIQGLVPHNEVYKKFIKSFNAYKQRQSDQDKIKQSLMKDICQKMQGKKLSAYKLNKVYNVNLKIAYQIKNQDSKVSSSVSYLNSLFNTI